jgi:integrase
VFLTVVLTGIRCAEMQKLKWTDVDLIENRLGVVDSKRKTGERSIALPRCSPRSSGSGAA